jgi:CSLREA domain-containing protein
VAAKQSLILRVKLRFRIILFFTVLALTIGLALLRVPTVFASVLEVTSTADNLTLDGVCTLREAITVANGTPITDCTPVGTGPVSEIRFSPAVFPGTINVTTPLPALTAGGVTIDGDLNGDNLSEVIIAGAPGAGSGLIISSAQNVLRSLIIVSFPGSGIVITGAGATENLVINTYIGTDDTSDPLLGNGQNGILIDNGASNNIIGSVVAEDRNVIGQNTNGIVITGADTTGNVVINTSIGVSEDATEILANSADGIVLSAGANNNSIGQEGLGFTNRNVISSNASAGVRLIGTNTQNNTIILNSIGTNLPGSGNLGNANGVFIQSGASNNLVSQNFINFNQNGIIVNGASTTGNRILD